MSITPELLDALLSPQADRRRAAEAHLQQMSDRCPALMQALASVTQTHHQKLVCVLLRRDILKLTDLNALQSLVDPLLQAFKALTSCRAAIGDCLAEVCAVASFLDLEQGKMIMQQILQAIGTAATQADVPALQCIVALADRSPTSFAELALPSLSELVRYAADGVPTDSASFSSASAVQQSSQLAQVSVDLVVKAAMASSANDESMDPDNAAAQLGFTCLLPLLQRLPKDPDGLSKILEHLLQATEQAPALFVRPNVLQSVLQTCLSIASNDEQLQLQAVQVVASLSANPHVKRCLLDNAARQAILQGNDQWQGLVTILLQVMTSGVDGDIEGWATDSASLQDDVWDDDELADFAQQLLESILHTFGSMGLTAVLQTVEHLLQSSDWRMQRAGLAALQCGLEAAPVSFATYFGTAVEAALSFSSCSNVRVQYQALTLLGVMCETAVDIREQYAARLLHTLAVGCQSNCAKVSAMSCLAIVSYCRGDGKSAVDGERYVVPFISDVLQALVAGPLSLELTNNSVVVVKIRAIGAVACLAEASGPAFAPFYSNIMPGLLATAQLQSQSHEMSQLKGSAIESATIIGQAIGEDNRHLFVNDASQIMQWALPVLEQSKSSEGMPMDQLLAACARIASVMGKQYAPYIDAVLPHLMKRATEAADIEIAEGDEAGLDATKRKGLERDEDLGTESMTMAVPGKGLTKVTVNTTQIQEKAQAVRAIYEHAAALGASFGPYAKNCLDELLLLVRFKYSSEIRAASAQTLAAIFEAACAYGEESGMEVPATYLPLVTKTIAKQIHDEGTTDMEIIYALADSHSGICYSVYCRLGDYGSALLGKFSVGDAKVVVQLCMKAMVACLHRRGSITRVLSGDEGALTGDDEKEEYEELLRDEEALLTPLVDSVGYFLKFFRQDFVPIFEAEVTPVLGPYLSTGDDIRARVSAVCLFDDCVEHCGEAAAARFSPMLIKGILVGLDDRTNGQDDDLKQASIYGVAQVARYAPPAVLSPHIQGILNHLCSVANGPKQNADNLAIFENAVSALASLLLIGNAPFKASNFVKNDTAMKVFLSSLPLHEDPDEAKICHSGLCDLVEQACIKIDSECRQLVRIIGETLASVADDEDIASAETCVRFAGILFRMQKEVEPQLVQSAFAALPNEAQTAINNAMGEHAYQFSNVVTP